LRCYNFTDAQKVITADNKMIQTHIENTQQGIQKRQKEPTRDKGTQTLNYDSGYRTACRSSYLKPYSTTTCNMTVTHDESAVGLVKT